MVDFPNSRVYNDEQADRRFDAEGQTAAPAMFGTVRESGEKLCCR